MRVDVRVGRWCFVSYCICRLCMLVKIHATEHYAGVKGTAKLIYGPGDLEGHLGTDGRYYALVCILLLSQKHEHAHSRNKTERAGREDRESREIKNLSSLTGLWTNLSARVETKEKSNVWKVMLPFRCMFDLRAISFKKGE